MPNPRSAVLLLSGGLDSTVLLAHLLHHGYACHTLTVDYGARHGGAEIEAAVAVSRHYGVPWQIADLRPLVDLLAPNALTGAQAVPHGHYTDASMAATVVPGRNLLMLALAAAYAAKVDATVVATAVHAGDHPIYPDCRREFIHAADLATQTGTEGCGDVTVLAPLIALDKAGVVTAGQALGVPFGLTWSCYEGETEHCGRCATCVERAEAFWKVSVPDPTQYADPDYFLTVTRGAPA